MSLFNFQNKYKYQHLVKKYCDIEKLLFLNSHDENDFVLLDPTIVESLGFTGEEENMLFIIESMERVVKGASIRDENCNFIVTDGKIFLKKPMFQHFVIISDAPKVKEYLIDANSVIRASFSLRSSTSTDKEYSIKELTEQNYKKVLKSYNGRDDLIDLMESVYSYVRCNNGNSPKECIYCFIEHEIQKDLKKLEEQILALNEAFDLLRSLVNKG